MDWNSEKDIYEDWIRNFAENLIQANFIEDKITIRFRKIFDIKVKLKRF